MRRPVTIVDIARESGFSINTVSRALNNAPGVNAQTRARVLAVAERLHYTPSRVARSLLTKSTKTLGLIVTDCTNPFYARVIRAVEDTAFAAGYGVIVCNSGEQHDREVQAVRLLLESRVDGMLITPTQYSAEHIADLIERKVPFVLVGRRFENLETCYVTTDNAAGAEAATRLLLSLGHRRIGHTTGRQAISSVRERLIGYRSALSAFDIPFDESLVARAERDVAGGKAAAQHLLDLDDPPTAIFAYNDLQALGVLQAARARGRRVPDELAVVGYDDIELAAFFEVPLTTVAQPTYALGQIAVELLFQLIEDPASVTEHQIVLQPELIVRASAGGPVSRR